MFPTEQPVEIVTTRPTEEPTPTAEPTQPTRRPTPKRTKPSEPGTAPAPTQEPEIVCEMLVVYGFPEADEDLQGFNGLYYRQPIKRNGFPEWRRSSRDVNQVFHSTANLSSLDFSLAKPQKTNLIF